MDLLPPINIDPMSTIYENWEPGKDEFSNFSPILDYKYIDMSTWGIVEERLSEVRDFAENASKELLISNSAFQDVLSIVAAHCIHQSTNQESQGIANTTLRVLLSLEEEERFPIFLYLKGKFESLQGNDTQAIGFFLQAKQILIQTKESSNKMRTILQAIGSITAKDPGGIEKDVLLAVVTNDLGNVFLSEGNAKMALEEFEKALVIQEKAYRTENHANIAYTFRCMGKALEGMNEFKNAEDHYLQALSIAQKVYSNMLHQELVEIYLGIGNSMSQQQNPMAKEYLERGYEISLCINGKMHKDTMALASLLKNQNAE